MHKISSRFASGSPAQALYIRLYCASAPVLEGVKPALLFNLFKDEQTVWEEVGHTLLDDLRLDAFCVYRTKEGFSTFLFYRAASLQSHLNRPEIKAFLSSRGYPASEYLADQLNSLKEQYQIHQYPHEIGIFLGYPLADVRGFILHKGRDYKLRKYWKVYGDVKESLQLFTLIDLAKSRALQSVAAYTS
ncbi:DUF3793 family protein [Oscillospiraceae bacterium MB08-C2-2]|nr:DUF3793 family protein [Oscillospiraceae bacterium MB08-C2-2]